MHFHTLRLIETHTWSTSPASQNQVTRSNGFLDTVSTLGNAHASTPLRESARPVNKSWLCLSGLMRASRQYRSRLGPLG